MFRFLSRLFLICLPALLLLGYIEYRLGFMDTHYRIKRDQIEKQLDKIEVLNLGPSNSYFDFNPAYYSHYGYNLAFNQQSPYYDYQLTAKYIDRMPKLKVIVLPAVFYSLGTYFPKVQGWRMYFYRLYFGLPLQSDATRVIPYDWLLEPKSFSKIALFGRHTYDYIDDDFTDRIDYHPENNGWFNADTSETRPLPPPDLSKKVGENWAVTSNADVSIEQFDINLAYWQRIVDMAKPRGIKVIVVCMPSHASYYDNLDPVKLDAYFNALKKFTADNQLPFADYTKDPRFSLEDYTAMIDHLNARGAARFSSIFNKEQLDPLFDMESGLQ